ncbi:MAG: TraM recognition domain-containing protein [Candidatus Absconditabacterales bacterium]|nr:TraM recognition domain-containing protein [Candidatus Absconditabacterales bacterium]
MADAMNNGKIILINLSKGKIGEDNANLLGSLITTKIQIDAMARANIHASQRRFFALYIDEFQNFVNDSFVTILSEARKYKLALIMAHQYTSQLPDGIKQAIFGNIGSMIAFTVGIDDARILADQFGHELLANDFLSLPKFRAYAKLTIQGNPLAPFVMQTALVTHPDNEEMKQAIIAQTREQYAAPRRDNTTTSSDTQKQTTPQAIGGTSEKKSHVTISSPSTLAVKKTEEKPKNSKTTQKQPETIKISRNTSTQSSDHLISQTTTQSKARKKEVTTPLSEQSPASETTKTLRNQPHTRSKNTPTKKTTQHKEGHMDFGLTGTPDPVDKPIPTSGPGRIPLAYKTPYIGTIVHTKNYGCMIQVEDSVGLLHKSEIIDHFPKDERRKLFVPGKTLRVYVKRRDDTTIERTVYEKKSGE